MGLDVLVVRGAGRLVLVEVLIARRTFHHFYTSVAQIVASIYIRVLGGVLAASVALAGTLCKGSNRGGHSWGGCYILEGCGGIPGRA
jgi:hypothetical protein